MLNNVQYIIKTRIKDIREGVEQDWSDTDLNYEFLVDVEDEIFNTCYWNIKVIINNNIYVNE